MKVRARKWDHHHPRTATSPITIAQYRAELERDLMVNHKRLTPEYQEWGWRQVNKHRNSK
jgi:hypothetical protein